MANDLNQCNFIGRLGKDVEMKYAQNGNAIANFSIAVGESWKDKITGEKKEKTEWVNLSCFGKLAEICGQYLKKGSKVYISGKLETRKWQDQSGADRYSTGVQVKDMQMLDSLPQGQQMQHPQQQAPAQQPRPQMAPTPTYGTPPPNRQPAPQHAPQQPQYAQPQNNFDDDIDQIPF